MQLSGSTSPSTLPGRVASVHLVITPGCCSSIAKPIVAHRRVTDLPSMLKPGDLLIVNDTKVLAARVPESKDGQEHRSRYCS